MINRLFEVKDSKVIIDFKYFKNVFIKPIDSSNISGLTLRLMAILMVELSEYESRRLPSRRKLAKILGANTSSIHKCLIFLEKKQFFFRVIDPNFQSMVRVNPEEQAICDQIYQKKVEENQKKNTFNDYFQLNISFNSSFNGISIEEFTKDIVTSSSQVINDVVSRFERKMYKTNIIQSFLQELLLDQSILSKIIEKVDETNEIEGGDENG